MKSSTITQRLPKRRKHAQELLDEHTNDWGGSQTLDELVAHPWAVVIERDSDSWVVGCDGPQQLAEFVLADCQGSDGPEQEWIACVIDLDTGDEVAFSPRRTVEIQMADGSVWEASDR